MKKKLTLRLLTALMVIMTAVVFMPTTADTVWAEEETGGSTGTTLNTFSGSRTDEEGNGNGIDEFVVNVSFGDVSIDGGNLNYSYYDPATKKIVNVDDGPKTDDSWYGRTELVVTGTSPSTYYKMSNGDIYLTKAEAEAASVSEGQPYDEITKNSKVTITGYTHKITLEDLNMQATEGSTYIPIELKPFARAIISLCGTNNTIKGNFAPAIYVPEDASLTIQDITETDEDETKTDNTGSLTASASNSSAAAIGGWGQLGDCGNINITSGIINATGAGAGAGIGGSGSGSGDITISGGKITATGGSITGSTSGSGPGAPGIGSGNSLSGGSVTITGGEIAATGGTGTDISNNSTYGIASSKLSSNGSTVVLSSTNGVYAAEHDDDFNALIWTSWGENPTASVYGDALIQNGTGNATGVVTGTGNVMENGMPTGITYPLITLGSNTVLTIPDDTTLTSYPVEETYIFQGTTLTGDGHLVGKFQNPQHDIPSGMILASLYAGWNKGAQGKPQHDYIHVMGLDEDSSGKKYGEYTVYNGKAKTLTKDLIKIDKTNGDKNNPRDLDTEDWEMTVRIDNTRVDQDKIINAGTYSIDFKHKQGFYPSFTIGNVQILPKRMTESMVSMDSPYSYGEEISYSVSDGSTNKDLTEGIDYEVKFYRYETVNGHKQLNLDSNDIDMSEPENRKVGSYAAVFIADHKKNNGNYTTEGTNDNTVDPKDEKDVLIVDFVIEPTSIKNAKVTINGSSRFMYNSQPMDLTSHDIEVTINGEVVDNWPEGYTIEFKNNSLGSDDKWSQRDHITYAGTVETTITPTKDNTNYTDYVIATFEIAKRPVKVASAKVEYADDKGNPQSSRYYDGTNIVKIKEAKLAIGEMSSSNCVVSTDENDVWIDVEGVKEDPTDDLTGTLKGSDVDSYDHVTLSSVTLAGEKASNYTVVESSVELDPKFNITKLPVKTPSIEISDKLSSGDKEKFLCTVKVTNAPNSGAMYMYGIGEKEGDIDNIKWQTSNEFDKLTSNTTYWFYCKVDEESDKAKRNTYPDPQPAQIAYAKHKTPLIPQDPPEEFELEITLDPNGETYTVTIPEQEGAQYSFDGKNYSKSNVLKKVGANETVTGYARFPATKTHAISDPVSATDVTPPLTVKTPVISPENGAFYGSVKVSITCGTDGATIYYTTDGNYPVAGKDEVYKSPITVTEDTTISAIAVKNDMEESELASVDYVYTEFPPESKSNVTTGVKVTNDLKTSPAYNQKDSITAALSRAITEDGGGYTYQNIAYYDLQIQLCFDGTGKNFVKANADNFPEEGVEITVPVPKNTSTSTHDFRVAHMFSETSDRLGITAGEIEKPEPAENGEALTFTVNGCSPLAIGWVETDDGSAAGDADANNDDDDVNAEGGDDADTLNANGQTGNADGDAANAAGGADADGANGGADGAGADGENADGEGADGQGGAGGVVDELVNAVTTGDYTNPYFWAAVAMVSLLLIIIIAAATRRRRA